MGLSGSATSPVSAYGKIEVRCDTPTIMAGNDVKGVLVLDMQRAYPFPAVQLLLEGKEIVRTKHNALEHSFLSRSMPIPVPALNDVLQPGHYEISFVLPLPVDVPASVSELVYRRIRSEILYTLKGDLCSSVEPQLPRMSHTLPFAVLVPLLYDSNAVLENLVDVTGAFRGRRGLSGIRVELSKTGLHIDEGVRATVTLNNVQCRCDLKRVQCTLISQTTFQVKHAFGHASKVFTDTIAMWSWPGVHKGQMTSYVQEVRIPQFRRPVSLQTIVGTIIKREYTLLVVPMYDLFFVYAKPHLAFPLTISAQPSQPSQPFPQGYQQVLPVYQQAPPSYQQAPSGYQHVVPPPMPAYLPH